MAKNARPFIAAGLGLALAGSLAACGSDEAETAAPMTSSVIDAERCAANQAAGKVTFLTSFQYAATAGILDVLAADQLGYFDEVCLDVEIRPGGDNTQLISTGKAQIGGMGSPGDVLLGRAQGAKVISAATYGNTSIDSIITMDDGKINSIKDFEGKKVGYKGYLAPGLKQMLVNGGADLDEVTLVPVGYDPTILPQGQVDAIGAYQSNEPHKLAALDYKVKVWDPAEFGVENAFNTQLVNEDFAAKHPTAVSDFLRASFAAFDWMGESEANLDEALGWAEEKTESGFDFDLAKLRITTEMEKISSSLPEGQGLGAESVEKWTTIAENMVKYELLEKMPDVEAAVSTAFVADIYDGAELKWTK